MWKEKQEQIEKDVIKYKIASDKGIITIQEAGHLLTHSTDFIFFFNNLLKNCPYEGYFWEVRPVNIETANEEFEFVLVNCTMFSKVKADNSSFFKYFTGNKLVSTFQNLSGDAKLIVPVAISNSPNYAHIANFTRLASNEQIAAFWKKVGEEFCSLIGPKTIWLSTSGLGVYWLHVRIDLKPKYYSYSLYKGI